MFDPTASAQTPSSSSWHPPRLTDSPPVTGDSPQSTHESTASEQQRCEALCVEITTLAGHLNAANEPGTLGNVSAETIAPQADESVSAETSGGESDAKRPTPIRIRRATALVHIAEHYLATGGSGARPLTSSEAYQVFIHVNANDASPDNRINGAHTMLYG